MQTTLGAALRGGGSIKTGPFGTVLKADEYTNRGAPVISVGEIKEGYFSITADTPRVDTETTGRLPQYLLEPGDVVFARKGGIERNAYVSPNEAGWFLGSDGLRARPSASLNGRFLAFQVRDPRISAWLHAHSTGSTMASLSQGVLEELPIWLPPLPEQQAIAEVLGALDDKIAANRALVATADELAQAITAEALRTSSPAALSDLADVTMGSSPKGSSYNEAGVGVVLYQGMRDFGVRSPTPRIWTTEPVRLAQKDDLLMSVRAPVGTLNRATEECCIGRGLAAIRATHPNALFHALMTQQDLFVPFNGDGTIFGSINKQQLHSLTLQIPETGMQRLEGQVRPLEEVISAALAESTTLSSLRDTLLPALMDGTLRVKDAEETVSGAL